MSVRRAPIPAPKTSLIRRDLTVLKDGLFRVSGALHEIQREMPNLDAFVMPKTGTSGTMDETEALRLQMAMDRVSKLMSTLSNLMKKAADTQNAIVQNLK